MYLPGLFPSDTIEASSIGIGIADRGCFRLLTATIAQLHPIRPMDNAAAASRVTNPGGAAPSQQKRRRHRGNSKRIRLPVDCADRVIGLTQQLGFRTDGDTVTWLLSQAEPAIVAALGAATYPSSASAAFQLPIPVPGGGYTGDPSASSITAASLISVPSFGGTEAHTYYPVTPAITPFAYQPPPPPYSWGYPVRGGYQPPYGGGQM